MMKKVVTINESEINLKFKWFEEGFIENLEEIIKDKRELKLKVEKVMKEIMQDAIGEGLMEIGVEVVEISSELEDIEGVNEA